jgi:hypothetical protein
MIREGLLHTQKNALHRTKPSVQQAYILHTGIIINGASPTIHHKISKAGLYQQ